MIAKLIVVTLALLQARLLLSSGTCGSKFKNKIVGGSDVRPNEWPWLVSIQFNFGHICTGTLVSDRFVLTAAHCFKNPTSLSAYKMILGAHNVSLGASEKSAVRASIAKLITHENYYTDNFDVALVKLNKAVEFSKEILPACLALPTDDFEGQSCYHAGWGYTYEGGLVQETPRQIALNTLYEEECRKYESINVEHKYCTGKLNTLQDTCQGDSGAGQYCLKRDGRYYVAGIVSYGVGNCGNVGINMRVDYFSEWISQKMNENA